MWKVKASDTLKKKYGVCYNKNLLFIAILRARGIACILCANPMARTFVKPATGAAHRTISNPFNHCFTKVMSGEKWIALDPTLDKKTYDTFFKPLGVGWGIDWNEKGMPPLYEESILGPCKEFHDIDKALNANLDSWFIFKYEPDFLLRFWLWMGNLTMWKKMDVGGREVKTTRA
ncbi:MAG: transglutaminase family protein [Desulfobacteraceae bacterium]|nr:transglutaminase family protein [Desulfobacteraceae bacterium]